MKLAVRAEGIISAIDGDFEFTIDDVEVVNIGHYGIGRRSAGSLSLVCYAISTSIILAATASTLKLIPRRTRLSS